MPKNTLPVAPVVPPARKRAPAGGRRATTLLSVIRFRRKCYENDLAEAVANQRWSHVAGLDGIITGLTLAERLVKDEMGVKK